MSFKITCADDIKKVEPPENGVRRVGVVKHPGLKFRITPATKDRPEGSRAWDFVFVPKLGPQAGSQRTMPIGPYPEIGFGVAKDRWRALRRRVADGEDPLQEIQEARRAPTMKELAEKYLETHLPRYRPESARQNKSKVENVILPKFGSRKLDSIAHADIEAFHHSLRAKPYKANRCVSLIRFMFNLAIKWGWYKGTNPALGIDFFAEPKRERFLSQKEIARLSVALAEYPNQTIANACRMLLLTGARRGEVLQMRWRDVDMETGVWIKPAETTKANREHRVPLSAGALEVLANQRGIAGGGDDDLVFPGRFPDRPCDLKNAWAKIRKAADLEGVRLHDLRHTHASILVSGGASLPLIGALLGHTQPATTARYAHLFDEPLREATEKVSAHVSSASKPTADVVKLRG